MIAYFDASAIVKLLIHEDGSDVAEIIWDEADRRITSLVTYVECRAALAAAVRSRRLTTSRERASREQLAIHWSELDHVSVAASLVRDAGELAQAFALRAYDALHLASAHAVAEGGQVSLVSWDAALVDAGHRSGLLTAPT